MLLCLLGVATSLCAACPTRTNPDLPPADGDGDGDADRDADGDGDCDADGDGGPCLPGSHFCDGTCVSLTDDDHCGLCGRACTAAGGCVCDGEPPECRNTAGQFCFEGCTTGDLICEVSGTPECVDPARSPNCGGCDVECEEVTDCECRYTGSTGVFECLLSVSGDWEDCTRMDP